MPRRTPSADKSATETPGPWLTQEEQLAFLAVASLVIRLPGALDDQLKRDAGLSHYEYLVMAALSMAPERTLRMSEIAEFTDSALSRLSNVATRLEKRGWITRAPDPQDGRYTLATLTDAGMEQVVAAAPGHVAEVRRIVIDPLTATQQAQLRQICGRMLRAIDPDAWRPESRLTRITRPRD